MCEIRWLAVLVVFVCTFFVSGLSISWACSPATQCVTEIQRGGLPSCVEAEAVTDCERNVEVINTCDQSVELVEVDCEDECSEPVVFDPGESGTLDFESDQRTSSKSEVPVGWSLGENEGILYIRIVDRIHEDFEGCPDPTTETEDAACTTSGPSLPPTGLAALGIAALLLWWRGRRSLSRHRTNTLDS